MNNNTTYFEGQISKISSRADHSWSLTINIPEYAASDSVPKLMAMNSKVVKMVVTRENITDNTIETLESIKSSTPGKTLSPSQQLRNKIYQKFMELGGEAADFNDFYKQEINDICDHLNQEITSIKNEPRD